MRFVSGLLTAFALVFVWVKWSRPWLQWLFSRGDA